MKRIVAILLALTLCFSVCPAALARQALTSQAEVAAPAFGALPTEADSAAQLGITAAQLKTLVAKIQTAAKNYATEVDVSEYGIVYTSERNSLLSLLAKNSDPEVFHIGTMRYYFDTNSKSLVKIALEGYLYTKEVYEDMLQKCQTTAKSFTDDLVASSLSDAEKALVLHDRLAVWCQYDTDWDEEDESSVAQESYSMYGALVLQKCVCQGYAKAYQYMLEKLGVATEQCVSYQLAHMWNVVTMDGKRYHVDITWDDPVPDIPGRVNHSYFLRSTGAFNHNATDYDKSPTATDYDTAWWSSLTTQVVYLNGELYYLNAIAPVNLQKRTATGFETVTQVSGIWYNADKTGTWTSQAKLVSDGTYLYFNTNSTVYRYDPKTGAKVAVFTPDLSAYKNYSIFGLRVSNGTIYAYVGNTPNLTDGQTLLELSHVYTDFYAYADPDSRSGAGTGEDRYRNRGSGAAHQTVVCRGRGAGHHRTGAGCLL